MASYSHMYTRSQVEWYFLNTFFGDSSASEFSGIEDDARLLSYKKNLNYSTRIVRLTTKIKLCLATDNDSEVGSNSYLEGDSKWSELTRERSIVDFSQLTISQNLLLSAGQAFWCIFGWFSSHLWTFIPVLLWRKKAFYYYICSRALLLVKHQWNCCAYTWTIKWTLTCMSQIWSVRSALKRTA